MTSAQGGSLKGIEPRLREAAREAAARKGMTLGEYLAQALAERDQGGGSNSGSALPQRTPRMRSALMQEPAPEPKDEWRTSAAPPRGEDAARLTLRVESIERRTQLALSGLDRAVSTIDRSVMGLAARIDDAENASTEAAERIADALEQFRLASETLGGRLQSAEEEVVESRHALDIARDDMADVKERLESQVAAAQEVARRAEAAASFLSSEIEQRDAAVAQTLTEARSVAEEAARQAAEASADAVIELRRLQDAMSERLAETETSTRRAIETAISQVQTEALKQTREAVASDLARIEAEIARRVGTLDNLQSEHAALIARIERAESGARDATAGLRQAAGAAIADLRNTQLTLAARMKQVEDIAANSSEIDLTDLRHAQRDIAERLAALEAKTDVSPVLDALTQFEGRLATVETDRSQSEKINQVGGTVKDLDQALARLAERFAETEATANTAIRTLEETVSALGARVEQSTAASEQTEAVRAMLEQRLDAMAQNVRDELAAQLQTVMENGQGVESALADVNRRLASAERRQAQTIEAISLEIKRMSETVDKRLRAVETRNDDAAAAAVREELSRMAETLEQRFDDIERREAAAFDRMGLEVGRLSERLEERVGAVETRSAQAIEHVGEQVARMAERFSQRHEMLSREMGERMLDSEERAGARVSEAISSIMQRLAEVEERSAEAIAPVQKAVSSVASKLEQYESARDPAAAAEPVHEVPAARASDAFADFGGYDQYDNDLSDPAPAPYVSPQDAAQPARAAPLAPPPYESPAEPLHQAQTTTPTDPEAMDESIYFADDDLEDLLVSEADLDDTPPTHHAPPHPPAAHGPSIDDDLLIEDRAHDEVTDEALLDEEAGPAEDLWEPEESNALEPDEFNAHNAPPELELLKPEKPPGRYDYLANARRAAQAQALPQRTDSGPPPQLSLRGSSRVVLWGAASAIALLLMGGAWYINRTGDHAGSNAPEPAAPEPAPAEAAPSDAATPADPFAEPPVEGLAPTEGAPVADGAPIAQNQGAMQPASAVVAGPLAPRAAATLEQAAEAGDLAAQYELALQRLGSGRAQEGVTMLRRAADRGLAMAQYRLAKLYERGEGVPADLAMARQWTERAAAGGNRRAMHDLGVYFARGEGAPADEAAAFRWFRQAAELGVADSQYNLGVLYQQGRGVNASPTEAMFWFLVAAGQGDADAATRAAALEAQLPQAQVEQARARARAFRPRAASAVANGEFGPRPWAQQRAGT